MICDGDIKRMQGTMARITELAGKENPTPNDLMALLETVALHARQAFALAEALAE